MSKVTTASLIALTATALLAGCAKKEESGTATTAEQPAAAAPAPAAQPTEPHPMPGAPAAEVDLSGIAKAEGGKTVAEVYAEKDQLAGQKVTVRGKIVKANPAIMDKNWLHVRDGSGEEGSNNLTVTTATGELPKVGDTVVVSGQLSLNKDFGMGYQYPVILEDATVTVE